MGDYICGHCGDMIEDTDLVALVEGGEKPVVLHCEEDRRCSDQYRRTKSQVTIRYEVPMYDVADLLVPDIDVPTMRSTNPVTEELALCCIRSDEVDE